MRTVLRLSPWLLVSLLLAAVLGSTDTAAVSGLFQSPATDTPTSEPTTPPQDTPTVPPEATATVPAEATPTELPTATTEPTATVLPTDTPPPTEAPPTATNTPVPTDAGAQAQPTEDGSTRYADEESTLRFEWGMLFDSIALGLSYTWLCCGALVLVSVPIVFVVLWVASKRRRQQKE
jgi:hypothetical protein